MKICLIEVWQLHMFTEVCSILCYTEVTALHHLYTNNFFRYKKIFISKTDKDYSLTEFQQLLKINTLVSNSTNKRILSELKDN